MSIIAELRIRSEDLVLASALGEVPDVRLDLVTEVATDPHRPYMFIWVRGEDRETFETAMADDPTVADVRRYTDLEDRTFYRIQVSEETPVVTYPAWVEHGVNLLEATWRSGWWQARMRVPDREAIARFREMCRGNDVDFQLDGVFTDEGQPRGGAMLTAEQREVLLRADELGYFEIPRQHTMAEIAEELDVSSQAVSERLRRALRELVSTHVR